MQRGPGVGSRIYRPIASRESLPVPVALQRAFGVVQRPATSSLSNHPSSCGGAKRRSKRWARAERCSTRSRSRCQLRSPIHTIFSMVFFSAGFNIPATRLCGLHSVWMGTPNIQRSRIRKARHFIFFPVYESLFLQACTRITRAAPQKFRSQSDVAVVGVGWRREGGQTAVKTPVYSHSDLRIWQTCL